jgi:hypothetical protein
MHVTVINQQYILSDLKIIQRNIYETEEGGNEINRNISALRHIAEKLKLQNHGEGCKTLHDLTVILNWQALRPLKNCAGIGS